MATAPAAPGVVDWSDLVVDVLHPAEQVLPPGREVEQLLVDLSDLISQLIFLGEEGL
jgi:hypothetical protein